MTDWDVKASCCHLRGTGGAVPSKGKRCCGEAGGGDPSLQVELRTPLSTPQRVPMYLLPMEGLEERQREDRLGGKGGEQRRVGGGHVATGNAAVR